MIQGYLQPGRIIAQLPISELFNDQFKSQIQQDNVSSSVFRNQNYNPSVLLAPQQRGLVSDQQLLVYAGIRVTLPRQLQEVPGQITNQQNLNPSYEGFLNRLGLPDKDRLLKIIKTAPTKISDHQIFIDFANIPDEEPRPQIAQGVSNNRKPPVVVSGIPYASEIKAPAVPQALGINYGPSSVMDGVIPGPNQAYQAFRPQGTANQGAQQAQLQDDFLLQQFMQQTGAQPDIAALLLKNCNGNLQNAIKEFQMQKIVEQQRLALSKGIKQFIEATGANAEIANFYVSAAKDYNVSEALSIYQSNAAIK